MESRPHLLPTTCPRRIGAGRQDRAPPHYSRERAVDPSPFRGFTRAVVRTARDVASGRARRQGDSSATAFHLRFFDIFRSFQRSRGEKHRPPRRSRSPSTSPPYRCRSLVIESTRARGHGRHRTRRVERRNADCLPAERPRPAARAPPRSDERPLELRSPRSPARRSVHDLRGRPQGSRRERRSRGVCDRARVRGCCLDRRLDRRAGEPLRPLVRGDRRAGCSARRRQPVQAHPLRGLSRRYGSSARGSRSSR
jgi:hypothetical protein